MAATSHDITTTITSDGIKMLRRSGFTSSDIIMESIKLIPEEARARIINDIVLQLSQLNLDVSLTATAVKDKLNMPNTLNFVYIIWIQRSAVQFFKQRSQRQNIAEEEALRPASDDYYVICKVGKTRLRSVTVELKQSAGKCWLVVTASYGKRVFKYSEEPRSTAEYTLPDQETIKNGLMKVLLKTINKSPTLFRPSKICNEARKAGLRPVEFILFSSDDDLTQTEATELKLRRKLSIPSKGIKKTIIHDPESTETLFGKETYTSEMGTTEWVLSSQKIMKICKNFCQARNSICLSEVGDLFDNKLKREYLKNLPKLEIGWKDENGNEKRLALNFDE